MEANHNEKNRYINQSFKKMVSNDLYEPDGNILTTPQSFSSSTTNLNQIANNPTSQSNSYHHQFQLANDRSNLRNANPNGPMNKNILSSAIVHPAFLNIRNDAQEIKFRGILESTFKSKYIVL